MTVSTVLNLFVSPVLYVVLKTLLERFGNRTPRDPADPVRTESEA
jgi:hypothetical protein